MKLVRKFLVLLALAAVSLTGVAACGDMNSGSSSSAGGSGGSSGGGGY
ncbi:hypothetical protein [Paraburkholderia adhaesiva]|nr:hypothetical protein [Paraburkholderia adhaesiva]